MIEVSAKLARKNFVLDVQIDFESRITGLFGPSGAGKSTLISIIAGLIKPDSGRIVINNHCVFDSQQKINIPVHQRHIGFVFQESRLFPHLSVKNNLTYGLKENEQSPQHCNTSQIAELLEIDQLLKQKPHQLSGGEKQRVAIGRALLSSPKLLLLDEPLASLDGKLKNQILPYLKKIVDEINIPMIYISHASEEIQKLTDKIVYINNGKIS